MYSRMILDSWLSCHPMVEMMNMQHCASFLQCGAWNLKALVHTKQVLYQPSIVSSFLQLLSLAIWSVSMLTCLPKEFVHSIFSLCICNGVIFRLNDGSWSRASGIAGLSYENMQNVNWNGGMFAHLLIQEYLWTYYQVLFSQMGVNKPECLIWDVYRKILAHIC